MRTGLLLPMEWRRIAWNWTTHIYPVRSTTSRSYFRPVWRWLKSGISGKRFVTAIVGGFKVACRVAAALQPSATNARGFHPTGTTGALGAAAVAGILLGLDAEQLSVAIGVA
jgi:hypothetical protein